MALRSPRFAQNQRLQRAANNNPPLRCGETGEAVRLLQQALIDLGFPMPISVRRFGSPDGIYGNETTTRVREFQTNNGLSADGIAGHDTLAKLDALLPNPAPPLPPLPAGPKFDRKVRLHFRSAAMPVVPEFTALDNAQKVYAQINVKLEFASGLSMAVTNEDLLRLDASDGTCNWNQASDELKLLNTLGGRQGVGPNDILVFYANRIKQNDGSTLNGCAGHEPGKPTVVVAATGSPWTLGHEVGHVLLGPSFSPVHTTDPKNLMFSPTASITANPPGFTAEQTKTIRASKFCLAI
jgi:peptidoglycan hydrolase-like protein with peptidoglycan-binding domain